MGSPRLFSVSEVTGLTEIVRVPKIIAGVRYTAYEHQQVPEDIREEVLSFVNGDEIREDWKVYREPYLVDRFNKTTPELSIRVATSSRSIPIKSWDLDHDIEVTINKTKIDPISYDLGQFINKGIGEHNG